MVEHKQLAIDIYLFMRNRNRKPSGPDQTSSINKNQGFFQKNKNKIKTKADPLPIKPSKIPAIPC